MTYMTPDSSDRRPDDTDRSALQIPLIYLFYAIAVLAAAMGVFGPAGMLWGTTIVGFWAWVFLGPNRPQRFFQALGVVFLLLILSCCLLPSVSSARGAARRMQCSNHLKQIGLALHNYHDIYQTLPPAYVPDAAGRPMHSWRVLILPFLEQQSLYDQYRFDEPWDGPNNRKLASQIPSIYACPGDRRSGRAETYTTSYVAVVGAETAWPLDHGRPFTAFTDGLANTLLVMESHRNKIHWMEPRDLSFEEAVAAFSSPSREDYGHMQEGFFYDHAWGRNTVLADGTAAFIGNLTEERAARLIGVEHGTLSSLSIEGSTASSHPPYRRPNYGNWMRLAVFLLILVLPVLWLRAEGKTGGDRCS